MPSPVRGEVWRIRFDPSEGSETRKVRPAVVLSLPSVGRLPLRVVVPVTGWKAAYAGYAWMVRLAPAAANGLTKDSAADAFQVKNVALTRFLDKLGDLDPGEVDNIAAAIALCVGAP